MRRLVGGVLAALALVLAPPLAAQGWPDRAVRLVVPYPAGGNVDMAARLVAHRLQERLGQPFIIDNRPGAGGLAAGELVAQGAPDGHTFWVTANGPLLYAPTIARRPGAYDWRRSFALVTTISFTPIVLQVHPSVPAASLGELIELARREPGQLTMATPGVGTSNHLLGVLLQSLTGARWETVHYRGNAPATADLVAGHVHLNFDQASIARPLLRDGRTRALAVASPARARFLPEVPTLAEAGLPGVEAETFTAVVAPARTPQAIIDRLYRELAAILAEPAVVAQFEAQAATARAMAPLELHGYLERESATWLPIIERNGIHVE